MVIRERAEALLERVVARRRVDFHVALNRNLLTMAKVQVPSGIVSDWITLKRRLLCTLILCTSRREIPYGMANNKR